MSPHYITLSREKQTVRCARWTGLCCVAIKGEQCRDPVSSVFDARLRLVLMSSGTLSTELCRQGSHYLLNHWHTLSSPKPNHHTALGVDQAKAAQGGGLHHILGALLGSRLPTLAAAVLPKQRSCSSITWISYGGGASYKGSYISAAVQKVSNSLAKATFFTLLSVSPQQCKTRFIFENNHTASGVKLVAYCTDDNFCKEGVVSAFGAKVSKSYRAKFSWLQEN